MSKPRKLVLIHKRAPGDTMVLTALIRDIALARPGEFEIDADVSAPDLLRHNPYLTPLRKQSGGRKGGKRDVEHLKMEYGRGIRDQNFEPIHFLHYFHRDFKLKTGVEIPPQLPYPDVHLSPEERNVPLVEGRYWVVLSGGKSDFTAKVWDTAKMQEVVHELRGLGLGAVQVGSADPGHWHPPLEGAINLVGRTNLRDLLRLIWHADGVICGVTCSMHAAAALQRPCVCIGGGREAWWWEWYGAENRGLGEARHKMQVSHRFLHTIGLLGCCQTRGCWVNKSAPLNGDKSICKMPVYKKHQVVPTCMDMISKDHVLEAVLSYYADATLPPLGAPLR